MRSPNDSSSLRARRALVAVGASIGRALALSAAAIGAGFFAFLPTSYVGVAELGTIAGFGMAVAFVLSIVLLPALLVLVRVPATSDDRGRLYPVRARRPFVNQYRRGVLAFALVAGVVATALLRWCASTSIR